MDTKIVKDMSESVTENEVDMVENGLDDSWTDKNKIMEEDFNDFIKTSHNDDEDEPKLVMIQGKNKDFLVSRRKVSDVIRSASFHRGFKEIKETSFKVTDFKNKQYSTECDVEVKIGAEKGKAKLTIYKDNKKKEGKKNQTIMISKKSKNDSKYVKCVTKLIEGLLEGFMKKEIKETDVVNEAKKVNKCDKCEKEFYTSQGLCLHKTRIHGEKKEEKVMSFDCDECEGKFREVQALNKHKNKMHKKEVEDKKRKGRKKQARAEF